MKASKKKVKKPSKSKWPSSEQIGVPSIDEARVKHYRANANYLAATGVVETEQQARWLYGQLEPVIHPRARRRARRLVMFTLMRAWINGYEAERAGLYVRTSSPILRQPCKR